MVQIISFQSIKYFDVSTVGMVCSLAPLFVCGLAYFILGEKMRIPDMVFLFSVFCCVILVLLGANKASGVVDEASAAEAAAMTVGAFAFFGLIA